MSKIIQTTDFVGKYSITQNSFGVADLQSFIDKYEKVYLYDLLGISLGDLFYADISTPFTAPNTLIYTTLFNAKYSDNDNANIINQIRSNGVKEMILGFVYFEYIRNQNVTNTSNGNVIASNEVSVSAKWSETGIYEVYNEAIKTYRSIQTYILNNLTVYPLFNGAIKGYICFAN